MPAGCLSAIAQTATTVGRSGGDRQPFRSERLRARAPITSSIASWIRPLVASTWPLRDVNGAPSILVTRPPASATISAPAATSQGLRSRLPEPVHPARRHVTEVDRRRSEPADGPRLADERAEQSDDLLDALVHVVGKAGDQHRIDQRRGRRHASGRPFRNAPPPRSAVKSSCRFGS